MDRAQVCPRNCVFRITFAEVIEQIAFLPAREDKRVDKRSGVSQRTFADIGARKRDVECRAPRTLMAGESVAVPRVAGRRIRRLAPSITGKLELEYEGELKGRRRSGARIDPAWPWARIFNTYFEGENLNNVVRMVRAGRNAEALDEGVTSAGNGQAACRGFQGLMAENQTAPRA